MNEKMPAGWVETTLGEIVDWSSGGTPDTKNKNYYNGDISWVVTGDLTDSYVSTTEKTITQKGLENSSAKIVPLGSVLIAMYGASIGRLGIANIKCATNQAIAHTKRIYGGITNQFLFYYLKASKEEIVGLGVGGAQPNISQIILKEFPIPIPPLAEQDRIVAILDGLMNRISSAQDQLNELAKIEKRLLRCYITNEDNELYPAVKLSGYCQEGKDRIRADWPSKRLIGVSKDDGIIDLRVGTKASFEDYKIVYPGDFLYNPMRVDIGSIGIYDGEEIAITSPDYIVFRITHTLSPLLLLKFLKSEPGLAEINNNTRGGVRSRLYFSNLCNINFPLGDEDSLQQAQKLLLVFIEVNKQKKWLEKKLDVMKQGFLAKAFAGELTEQNPDYEPASVLLERIRAERAEENLKLKEKKSYLTDATELKSHKKMAEQLRPIKDILSTAKTPVSAHIVWQQSIYKNDIEKFYAELKKLIDEEKSVMDVKEGSQSYLILAHAD